jgi:hypothetical protein
MTKLPENKTSDAKRSSKRCGWRSVVFTVLGRRRLTHLSVYWPPPEPGAGSESGRAIGSALERPIIAPSNDSL